MFTMRFTMRSRTGAAVTRADSYRTVLDMAEWAETRGCVAVALSQHHGVDDGYLPSPVPMAAAVAARTSAVPVTVAALLLAFYEPVKLAEDLAVVDLLSRGRVSYVVGIGYRDEEFAQFGIERRHRARLVEHRIGLLRRVWAGETVELDGRRVRVTPEPFTSAGPLLMYGGGSEVAARRAARLGMPFCAESGDPGLEAAYLDEAERAGITPSGCIIPEKNVPLTVFVADDPDKAWAEIGDHLLFDAVSYGRWNAGRRGTAAISFATSVAELKAERGEYQILTPDEATAYLARGIPLKLQPLVGGLPPDVGWRYLEAAAAIRQARSSRNGRTS
jgi:alkanesulfonate monooxygenase SsuD/methylene tetrahydromethanopterin reductase-like flavin-dependent oxidoreductase (luciferase family)